MLERPEAERGRLTAGKPLASAWQELEEVSLGLLAPPVALAAGDGPCAEIGWSEGKREVRILIEFEEFTGRYVFHCHNVEHEDMRMMGQFEVLP